MKNKREVHKNSLFKRLRASPPRNTIFGLSLQIQVSQDVLSLRSYDLANLFKSST